MNDDAKLRQLRELAVRNCEQDFPKSTPAETAVAQWFIREIDRLLAAPLPAEPSVDAGELAALREDVENLRAQSADRLRRLRKAAQTIIKAIGSNGPEDADVAAERAVAEIAALRDQLRAVTAERDEARAAVRDNVPGLIIDEPPVTDAAVRVATEARDIVEGFRDAAITEVKCGQPKPATGGDGDAKRLRNDPIIYHLDDGKFTRGTLVRLDDDGTGHLIVDLTSFAGPSVVGKPDWFDAGYVAVYGGLVPETAQRGSQPGQWEYGVMSLAAPQPEAKPAGEKCGRPFRSGPIEGTCANEKPCFLHDVPSPMWQMHDQSHGQQTNPPQPSQPSAAPEREDHVADASKMVVAEPSLADYLRWAHEARGTEAFLHRAADVAVMHAGIAIGAAPDHLRDATKMVAPAPEREDDRRPPPPDAFIDTTQDGPHPAIESRRLWHMPAVSIPTSREDDDTDMLRAFVAAHEDAPHRWGTVKAVVALAKAELARRAVAKGGK